MERKELDELAASNIQVPLPPGTTEEALSSPPFIPIPSALNLRDVGLVTDKIKPGLIFRSGALSTWPSESIALLASEYHIKTIFDLRNEGERVRHPPPTIDGVEMIWVPFTSPPTRIQLEEFVSNGGRDGFANMYEEAVAINAPAFTRIFRDILENPGEPFLFHCTAGKDRTGVIAALLEKLAGAEDEDIARDFALTRIGVEPAREMLTDILQKAFGVPIDTPGFKELSSCNGEFILGFLERVQERWGSVEGCCQEVLGLTKEEIENIKRNITVQ